MYRRQRSYGDTKSAQCPFCGRQATTKNTQGIPVCKDHKEKELLDLKCICGEYLDLKFSKHGPFFVCMRCGCVSFKKALEYNNMEINKEHSCGRMNKSKSQGSDTDSINEEFRKKINKNFCYEDHFE